MIVDEDDRSNQMIWWFFHTPLPCSYNKKVSPLVVLCCYTMMFPCAKSVVSKKDAYLLFFKYISWNISCLLYSPQQIRIEFLHISIGFNAACPMAMIVGFYGPPLRWSRIHHLSCQGWFQPQAWDDGDTVIPFLVQHKDLFFFFW